MSSSQKTQIAIKHAKSEKTFLLMKAMSSFSEVGEARPVRLDPVVFQVTKEITRSLYTFKQENADIFITDIAFNFVERNSNFKLVKIKAQRGIRLH